MEIQTVAKIHRHVFVDLEDENDRFSDWAYKLEAAIREMNYKYLMMVLGSGKGFNDRTKEAFCDVIGVPRTYSLKGIKAAISSHCSISVEDIELHESYFSAKRKLERKLEELTSKFANGNEVAAIVDEKIENGYCKVVTENRRTFLANDQNMGWPLQRVQIKEYAIAKLNFVELEQCYQRSFTS
ncbi:hypothetical protein FG064_16560 [Vibrio cholerae]|uniref:hypothetical protein n=1 Tax=Vibrio cholerae TaxID=666 RepID=UPI0011D9D9DF|nr:hypothetical protein [Vibrio cholerae]EGR0468610.1 hypothetical protein [Vibrio cholerae]TXY52012.1 hypothetical protein FXE74_18640 [Vibrio cholerae]GIB34711.1 hypothetical protein VCSRO91_3582 [Vibrio cholerae]